MIAVDTNVLVYAHRADSPFHARAREALSTLAESGQPWAIAWPCVHEFLAIATHPRIYRPPSSIEQALDQIDAWMEAPTLTMIGELDDYVSTLRAVLTESRVVGPRIHDARIASICIQNGVRRLWSADRDLSRFGGVSVVNPLVT